MLHPSHPAANMQRRPKNCIEAEFKQGTVGGACFQPLYFGNISNISNISTSLFWTNLKYFKYFILYILNKSQIFQIFQPLYWTNLKYFNYFNLYILDNPQIFQPQFWTNLKSEHLKGRSIPPVQHVFASKHF